MKATRLVRVRLDFVLDFNRALTGLPIDAQRAAQVMRAAAFAMGIKDKEDVDLLPGGRYQVGLHFPRLKAPPKKKAAPRSRP